MGLRIFLHSLQLVWRNRVSALRITGLLYLASIILLALISVLTPNPEPGGRLHIQWQIMPIAIAALFVGMWTAVAWHRYVLINEDAGGVLPPVHGRNLLGYLGRCIQLGLIGGLFMALMYLVMFVAGQILHRAPILVAPIGMAFVIVWIIGFYRVSIILPGAALGENVGVTQAWSATKNTNGSIFMLAVLSAIGTVVLDLPSLILANLPSGSALVYAWRLIAGWVQMLMGISIITTLYGVYIEGREV